MNGLRCICVCVLKVVIWVMLLGVFWSCREGDGRRIEKCDVGVNCFILVMIRDLLFVEDEVLCVLLEDVSI